MTDIAWEYLISRSPKRSKELEIKQITMKQLIEEVAPETNWGPQKVLEFCKMSVDDGDKFFAINMRGIQYQVPIAQVRAYLTRPQEAETPPVVTASPPEKEKTVVKKKAATRKK